MVQLIKQKNNRKFWGKIKGELELKIKRREIKFSKKNFNKIRNDFITEINKYDQNVGRSFSLILSDEIIIKKDFEIFLNGIICYERVFNNLYSYTQYYINKNIKSAVDYLNNYKNKNTQELQNSIDTIKEWFNELLNKIV